MGNEKKKVNLLLLEKMEEVHSSAKMEQKMQILCLKVINKSDIIFFSEIKVISNDSDNRKTSIWVL